MKKVDILGLKIDVLDYQTAFEQCLKLSKLERASSVSAANTQILAASKESAYFYKIMNKFDLILPDGMPLVWCINKKSSENLLNDRVYGPYFMEYALLNSPPETKHFFFGGSKECLDKLVNSFRDKRSLNICGSYSPPYRKWSNEDNDKFSKIISNSQPDFIWVALGGIKQETWIIENLYRYKKGVFFAVGDAFELIAGNRKYAPKWMQKRGLTWLYRLCQEPRRMFKRYLKYNILFCWYLLRNRK